MSHHRYILFNLILFFIIILVESKDCNCIENAIGQVRCPGSGIGGYFSGYGNCCFCKECSSCND